MGCAAIAVGIGVAWVDFDRLSEIYDGLIVVALSLKRVAAILVRV
jgi:hypothetical protein